MEVADYYFLQQFVVLLLIVCCYQLVVVMVMVMVSQVRGAIPTPKVLCHLLESPGTIATSPSHTHQGHCHYLATLVSMPIVLVDATRSTRHPRNHLFHPRAVWEIAICRETRRNEPLHYFGRFSSSSSVGFERELWMVEVSLLPWLLWSLILLPLP